MARGNIYDGNRDAGEIGGDTLADIIRRARLDDQVKALVLRIDSGGGSAFASEIIRSELVELRNAGKPLVVSMGSVAASGVTGSPPRLTRYGPAPAPLPDPSVFLGSTPLLKALLRSSA